MATDSQGRGGQSLRVNTVLRIVMSSRRHHGARQHCAVNLCLGYARASLQVIGIGMTAAVVTVVVRIMLAVCADQGLLMRNSSSSRQWVDVGRVSKLPLVLQ